MGGESAYDRHLRILAIASGFGTAIFTLLALPAILEQRSHLAAWAYVPLTVLFCGLPILLAPLGRWSGMGPIRWVARAHTVLAIVLLVVWLPSMTSPGLPEGRAPWVLNTLAVAAATSVIAWPARVAWIYVIALSIGGAALRYAVLGNGDLVIPFEDGVSMLGFSTIIATLLIVALRAGSAQDRALETALADARSAAEVQSRARQRARFGSFVHDHVITTLLAAARATRPAREISLSASRALNHLDEFVAGTPPARDSSVAELEIELRAAAREFADGVEFAGSLATFAGAVPPPVVLALTGALGEAIRNSVRHAATGERAVNRRVLLAATPSSISVEAIDDGAGFEPLRIAPERLGIRTSILGRMTVIAGGQAHIDSSVDGGTRVALRWAVGQGT